jgi:hypothetical protein
MIKRNLSILTYIFIILLTFASNRVSVFADTAGIFFDGAVATVSFSMDAPQSLSGDIGEPVIFIDGADAVQNYTIQQADISNKSSGSSIIFIDGADAIANFNLSAPSFINTQTSTTTSTTANTSTTISTTSSLTTSSPTTQSTQTISTTTSSTDTITFTTTETTMETASVYLYGQHTEVNIGDDIVLTLSAINLITNPAMTVQLILKVPSGMSVTSSEFIQGGGGQYTSTYTIEPWQQRANRSSYNDQPDR